MRVRVRTMKQRRHAPYGGVPYVCRNCTVTAPRTVACTRCDTELYVHVSTLRRGEHAPYGDAPYVCRPCTSVPVVSCTREGCSGVSAAREVVPAEDQPEFLCAPCVTDWVHADCVNCATRTLVRKCDDLPLCQDCTGTAIPPVRCQYTSPMGERCGVEQVLCDGSTAFLCEEHRQCGCVICGVEVHQPSNCGKFKICTGCEREREQPCGGDLLELAQSSPASILAAGKLARYAAELQNHPSLQLDASQHATLRRVLHQPAFCAIEQHMNVHDDEKVKLATAYRSALHYEGHVCATCGVRDAQGPYTCKMFDVCGSSLAGAGYLRRRDGAIMTPDPLERHRELIALPAWVRISCAAAASLKAHTCELRIPSRNSPDTFETVHPTAFDLRHAMDTWELSLSGPRPNQACRCSPGAACGRFLHVVEEAVQILHEYEWVSTSSCLPQPQAHPDVVVGRFWVCQKCAGGCNGRAAARRDLTDDSAQAPIVYSTAAPRLSIGYGADFGRLYMPARVARRTSWAGDLGRCKLPVPSLLELVLVCRVRLYLTTVKVTIDMGKRRSTDGCYDNITTHAIYFPQVLMDESGTRVMQPLLKADDAADALRIAVEGIQILLVGPNGERGRLEKAALTVSDFTLRPEVVYNLLQLDALARRVDDASVDDASVAALDEGDLSVLRDALTSDKLASLLAEVMVHKEPDVAAEDEDQMQSADVAGVRMEDTEGPSTGAVREMDATAAVADADSGPRALFAAIARATVGDDAARKVCRGADPLSDYSGFAETVMEAFRPLFPIGLGLDRSTDLSQAAIRRMMLWHDGRFGKCKALMFALADRARRLAVNRSVSVKVRASPANFARLQEIAASPELVEELREAMVDPAGKTARQVLNRVLPFVQAAARAVPHSDHKRHAFLGTILAHQRYFGPSNHFISWAPDDVHDPNALRESFPFRGIGKFPHMLRDDPYTPDGASDVTNVLRAFQRGESHPAYGDFSHQALQQRASVNPIAVTEHFDRRTRLAWVHLLGVDVGHRLTLPFAARPKGACGRLAAMTMVKECNGRKSQHIHALTSGSAMPEFVSCVVHDPQLRHALHAALGTQITGHLPTEIHTLENVRKALGVGRGHDASFKPFQIDAGERADAPIRVWDIKLCAHVVAMYRNLHVHCKSCQKGKRGQDGCRFSVPYTHGFDRGRCLQLVKYEAQFGDRFAPADARWCSGCVVPGRDGAWHVPFTDKEQNAVRKRIPARNLFYHVEKISPPAGRLALLGREFLHNRQQAQRALSQRRHHDERCLWLEVKRPLVRNGKYATLDALMGALEPLLSHPSVHLIRARLTELMRQAEADELYERCKNNPGEREQEQRDNDWARREGLVVPFPDMPELLRGVNQKHSACANGFVATFCELLSAGLQCNVCVYTLGAGNNARAAAMYFSKYNAKDQHELKHDTLTCVAEAAKHIRTYPSTADDSGTAARSAKHLAQRIMNSSCEMSATEAATVVLQHCSEVSSEAVVYIDAWGLCGRAVRCCDDDGAPAHGRQARPEAESMAGDDPDLRDRFGVESGAGYAGEEYAKAYTVDGKVVYATLAEHYAFRSPELAHLNALEFFLLYEVKKRPPGRASTAGAVGLGVHMNAGRPRNREFEFMDCHPLAQHHRIVKRSKLFMPLLAGSEAPRQPPRGARGRTAQWDRWAEYWGALFIPWGHCPDADGGDGARHFRPRLTVTDFEQWYTALELHSIRDWAAQLLEQHMRPEEEIKMADVLREMKAARVVNWLREENCRLPASVPGGSLHRDAGLAPSTTMTAYRLATLENMIGALNFREDVIQRANKHRNQSRDLWRERGDPAKDADAAWGLDEVTDMIREAQATSALLRASQSGAGYLARLERANKSDRLKKHLRDQLGTGASDSVEDSRRVWCGATATRGFDKAACDRAYEALRQPFTVAPSSHARADVSAGPSAATGPFSVDGASETDDGAVLHERQRAVGRHFMAGLRAVSGMAATGASDNRLLLCMGAAGCGKSKVIHVLRREVERLQLGRIVVTGFTGVCCTPFLTPNVFQLFNLAVDLHDRDPSTKDLERLRKKFKLLAGFDIDQLAGLVIDEISLVKPELLGRVSRLLQALRGAWMVMIVMIVMPR
jgi:hypothetical protein